MQYFVFTLNLKNIKVKLFNQAKFFGQNIQFSQIVQMGCHLFFGGHFQFYKTFINFILVIFTVYFLKVQ